jgi:hypothetical protein
MTEQAESLTETEREELSACVECMAAKCSICGHEPCPVCLDDCDNGDCLVAAHRRSDRLKKTHACVFARCKRHEHITRVW